MNQNTLPHPGTGAGRPRPRAGFTLIELLVVIGIIGLLIGLLLPALVAGRRASKALVCLSNLRQMQAAQILYANDFDGWLVQAGLDHADGDPHGHGEAGRRGDDDHDHEHAELDEGSSWLVLLTPYAAEGLVSRCPSDYSAHWPDGTPVALHDGGQRFRRTSYGINNYLSVSAAPEGHAGRWVKLARVRGSSQTVQFLEMAYAGAFAAADHPDLASIDDAGAFGEAAYEHAAEMLAVNSHGAEDRPPSAKSRANWGFLDGHAETRAFVAVYRSADQNAFNPDAANP